MKLATAILESCARISSDIDLMEKWIDSTDSVEMEYYQNKETIKMVKSILKSLEERLLFMRVNPKMVEKNV